MATAVMGRAERGEQILRIGQFLIRYGLVLVIAWIGALKFTDYEAEGIRPLVASSPFLGWLYGVLSVRGVSALFGVVELTAAALIAIRPISARASAIGSVLAIGLFLTTLSFLLTAPQAWAHEVGGFPILSHSPGQFLLKDVVLLGAAVWTLGDSLRHVERP